MARPDFLPSKGLHTLALVAGLIGLVACSGSDLSDMEKDYPHLVDIPPRPETIETTVDKSEVIKALKDEADARKDEGYYPPE